MPSAALGLASFDGIVADHAPKVRRYLFSRLRTAAAADEATQETFVRAYARWETLRNPDRVLPWLLGIARRVAAELRRSEQRHVLQADAPETEEMERDPEAKAIERETLGATLRAIQSLPAERRRALTMRVEGDLAYDDIASAMGWSLPKVKNEIHRARTELRTVVAYAVSIFALVFGVSQAVPTARGPALEGSYGFCALVPPGEYCPDVRMSFEVAEPFCDGAAADCS